MNTNHYQAVLADFERMKADAEDGIRLMKRALRGQAPQGAAGHNDGAGTLPDRITGFLATNAGKSYRAEDIANGLGGAVNMRTLRGTLIRIAKAKRIRRQGRGRYKAKPRR